MTIAVLNGYITRDELADQLGKSVRTMIRWEREQIGPPVTRFGNSTRYNLDDVRAWLVSQREDRPRRRTGR